MTPLEQGAKAFSDGVGYERNPFVFYTHDWDLWNEGWKTACVANMAKIRQNFRDG